MEANEAAGRRGVSVADTLNSSIHRCLATWRGGAPVVLAHGRSAAGLISGAAWRSGVPVWWGGLSRVSSAVPGSAVQIPWIRLVAWSAATPALFPVDLRVATM